MPKAMYRAKRGSKPVSITYKYKLGNRKSNVSAHTLSTKELIELFNAPKLKKDKPKIEKVLLLRGVRLGVSFDLAEEEQIAE